VEFWQASGETSGAIQVGVPWSHFCCELPSEELMRWQWVGRLKCIKFFLAYLDVGGLHINCLTSN